MHIRTRRTPALLATLLTVFLLASCSAEEDKGAEHYLASARQYLLAGDAPAALIELKNTLQRDPALAEARFRLGEIYLKMDENEDAEKEVGRARDLGWPADDVRPALAKAIFHQGRYEEVVAFEASDLSDSAAAQLLTLQAIANFLMGDAEAALAQIEAAEARAPNSVHTKIAQARVQSLRGDNPGALQALDKILADEDTNEEAWRLQGQLLWREDKLLEARTAFQQAIAHSTVNFADHIAHALIDLQLEDYESARNQGRILNDMAPRHASNKYIQGLLFYHDNQYRPAIDALTKALPVVNKYPRMLLHLSAAHLIDGELAIATEYLQDFLEKTPDSVLGRKMQAAILLQLNKTEQARDTLSPVLDYNPNDIGANAIMANILLQEGELEQSLVRFHRLSALEPNLFAGDVPLTHGLMESGFGSNSQAAMDAAIGVPDAMHRTEVITILQLLQAGETDRALEAAESFKLRNTDKIAPYVLLARVQIENNDAAAARSTIELATKKDPSHPSANLLLAGILRAEGDSEAERKVYTRILERHPTHLQTLLNMALWKGRHGDERGMARGLQRAIDLKPSALEPRLGLARMYLGRDKAAAVEELFAPLNALQQRSPRLLELYVEAKLALGQTEHARRALLELVATHPYSPALHYQLWRTSADENDPSRGREALVNALNADPNYIPALIASTEVALRMGEMEQARTHFEKIRALQPENASLPHLEAQLAATQGDYSGAVSIATDTFKSAPTATNLFKLVAAQQAAGQTDAALTSLAQWIDNNPDDISARLTLTNHLEALNRHDEAAVQYRAVLRTDPTNLLALNNLAWNLRTSRPVEARKLIDRAISMAPQEFAVLDTKAMIEHLNGDNDAALANLELALKQAPDNASLLFHKAKVLADDNDTAAALDILRRLQAGAAFSEQQEAQSLLQQLEAAAR